MAINPNWLRLVRKVFLFKTITGDQLTRVAKKMKLASVPKGATLFRAGDAGDALYIVLSGSLRLLADSAGRDQPVISL